jgi:hypothetical protein
MLDLGERQSTSLEQELRGPATASTHDLKQAQSVFVQRLGGPGALPPPGSRRPGLADFQHPVPRLTVSLCSAGPSDGFRGRQRKPLQHPFHPFPVLACCRPRPTSQPLEPVTAQPITKQLEHSVISGDAIVGVVPAQLLRQHSVLLADGSVSVVAAPHG